ncbi:hypothetical protein BZA77DRAFT_25759 [Pyronema omphalodes]|nr:hypothetical protein BZA77DRAFT_25759 [Pyronema omphalodes]
MTSEQPNHQPSDVTTSVLDQPNTYASPSAPLRTFRLSEIPPEMNDGALRRFLDSLKVAEGFVEGNSTVFSLTTYGSWQIATVSFHQEPDEFKKCKPGHQVYLQFPKRQISTLESNHEPDKRVRDQRDRGGHSRLPERPAETRARPARVTVDCDFYGMTPLYAPVGTTAKYDIIAVTGLSAHAFGSWKSPDRADRMWLRDFLPLDIPDIRVFTWGYYSSIRNNESTTSITGISRNFLEDIKRVREKETASRPLILIGHSLGGLVLQKALVDASKSKSRADKDFHQSCIGALFFGVPHLGLNPKSIDMLVRGMENEHFLRDISTGSDYLFELQKDFRTCYTSMESSNIVSFYESEDTCSVETFANGVAKRSGSPIRMVPRESAVCSVSEDHNRIEIRADHSRMVKFRSMSDNHYLRVIATTREMRKKYETRGFHERLADNAIRQIIPLISPLEPHKRHQDIRQKRLQGTGDWFLNDPAFQKWIGSQSEDGNNGSVLACSGNPGAGKSVMCSLVFDYIEATFVSDERACVACLYCDFQNDKRQTPVNMIGVLLNQVILTLNDSGLLLSDTVFTLRKLLRKHTSPELAEACRMLSETVTQLRNFYVCIDALDECSDVHRRGFLQALSKVASECSQSCAIRIFFTTRPHIKWQEFMTEHPQLGSLDHICLKAHPDDIRRYLSHEIEMDENSDCMNDELKTEILDTIVANSADI